jgi:hypothetical protein
LHRVLTSGEDSIASSLADLRHDTRLADALS